MNRVEAEMIVESSDRSLTLGEKADNILLGIKLKKGHCLSDPMATDATVCPCYKFRHAGECKCGLFVKE